ncbi:MAG TPA: cupin domain-containing protein [Longimicrobiaceae bacterium]|nr:cupin domain-containing protein [Longimicrobiaceae bacterium]
MTGGAFPAELRRFAERFRRGEFWESHETLEGSWRRGRSGFYKGLILLASAWVHVGRGNARGVAAQLRKTARELEPYRPAHLGVDVDALLENAARLAATVAADPAAGGDAWARACPPPPLALRPALLRGDEPELRPHPYPAPPMHPRAAELLRELDLQPHPEGGWFREVYRSHLRVRPDRAAAGRDALTTIYFLLASGERSRWHRVAAADEAWHFYEGDPLELFWLDPSGARCHRVLLGPVGGGREPVHVVPAGCWQAARPTGAFSLVGCTVGPGFEFEDFAMLDAHPDVAERIRRDFPELAGLV